MIGLKGEAMPEKRLRRKKKNKRDTLATNLCTKIPQAKNNCQVTTV